MVLICSRETPRHWPHVLHAVRHGHRSNWRARRLGNQLGMLGKWYAKTSIVGSGKRSTKPKEIFVQK